MPPSNKLFAVAGAAAVITYAGAASATPFTAPVGVAAYRLMFVTADGTAATSSSIATYNAFAQTEAQAATIGLPIATWQAVISTAATSAAANIDCGSSCDAVPIYMVDGTTLIASSTSSLFSQASFNSIFNQLGNSTTDEYVFTGSTSSGASDPNYAAGSVNTEIAILGGGNDFTAFGWYSGYSQAVYAISSEIFAAAPTSVPEPASTAMLLAGLVGITVMRRRAR